MANIVLNKVSATCSVYSIKSAVELNQGNLVVLGAQDMTNDLGVYTVAAPAAITDLGMVIVADVPLDYDATKVQGDHIVAIGEIGRAYQPYVGMVITIENSQIDASGGVAIAAGKYVIPKAGSLKMATADAPVGTESVVFIIDEVTTINGVAAAKIRCIKA